ncbi:MAG: protein translocase subunit SecF [bacterium]
MYKIIKNSNFWFIFSGTLSVVAILAIIFFGLRVGIDYKGGTVIEIQSTDSNKINLTKEVLSAQNFSNYQLKESDNNTISLRLPTLTNEQHLSFARAMQEKLPTYTETKYDTVGPTIGKDLTNKSIWAVLIASLGIIIFISYAFRKMPKPLSSWKFGLSAAIALIHDLLITTGLVAILGHFYVWMEVDALFITAMLTIMGFSVHDTIVVYDRLRENYIRNPHEDIEITAEKSINQTLARSINTSMTTIIVLTCLLVFGSSSIRHFIVILIFGITLGTYSSIFVASPLVVRWHRKLFHKA